MGCLSRHQLTPLTGAPRPHSSLRHCREGNENWHRLSAVQLSPRYARSELLLRGAVHRRAALAGGALADPPLRNPTTGNADCCARTESGQATAPPSPVMNSRRLTMSQSLAEPEGPISARVKITTLGRGLTCAVRGSPDVSCWHEAGG